MSYEYDKTRYFGGGRDPMVDRRVNDIAQAWTLEQLEKDSAEVVAKNVPLTEVYGREASALLGIEQKTQAQGFEAAAKIASNIPAETVVENTERTIARSGATRELLSASAEAARAVAMGIEGSGHLRAAGAAVNILKARL